MHQCRFVRRTAVCTSLDDKHEVEKRPDDGVCFGVGDQVFCGSVLSVLFFRRSIPLTFS